MRIFIIVFGIFLCLFNITSFSENETELDKELTNYVDPLYIITDVSDVSCVKTDYDAELSEKNSKIHNFAIFSITVSNKNYLSFSWYLGKDGDWNIVSDVSAPFTGNPDFYERKITTDGNKSVLKMIVPEDADEVNYEVFCIIKDVFGNVLYSRKGKLKIVDDSKTTYSFDDRFCKYCGEVISNNNLVEDSKVPADCHTDGYEGDFLCEKCKTKNSGSVIPATHCNVKTIGAVSPTLTCEGWTGDKYCVTCGEKLGNGKTIPKLSSSNDVKIKEQVPNSIVPINCEPEDIIRLSFKSDIADKYDTWEYKSSVSLSITHDNEIVYTEDSTDGEIIYDFQVLQNGSFVVKYSVEILDQKDNLVDFCESYQTIICEKSTCAHEYIQISELKACENPGKRVYQCKKCNKIIEKVSESFSESDEVKHNLSVVTINKGKCGEDSRIRFYCDICGYVGEEITVKTSHEYIKAIEVCPTCTNDGYYELKCVNCEDTIRVTIPHEGHTICLIPEVSATCLKEGIKEHFECVTCNEIFKDTKGLTTITKEELVIPIDKNNHVGTIRYEYDNLFHNRICVCGEKNGCASDHDLDDNDWCKVCQFGHTEQKKAVDDPKLNAYGIVLIIICSVVVLGIATLTVLLVVKIRKKPDEE